MNRRRLSLVVNPRDTIGFAHGNVVPRVFDQTSDWRISDLLRSMQSRVNQRPRVTGVCAKRSIRSWHCQRKRTAHGAVQVQRYLELVTLVNGMHLQGNDFLFFSSTPINDILIAWNAPERPRYLRPLVTCTFCRAKSSTRISRQTF